MQALQSLLVALTYPPALTVALLIFAALLALIRWNRFAIVTAVVAICWSGLLAIPSVSDWVRGRIESQYPPVDETTLPQADAIVVLGGATHFYWLERQNVTAYDLENSRLAAGARAWLAGKAPVVVLSGGGDNGGNEAASEARLMENAIQRLGVPQKALLLETKSRNTRDNARYTAQLADEHGFHRILLVTSSLHMLARWSNSVTQAWTSRPCPFPKAARAIAGRSDGFHHAVRYGAVDARSRKWERSSWCVYGTEQRVRSFIPAFATLNATALHALVITPRALNAI